MPGFVSVFRPTFRKNFPNTFLNVFRNTCCKIFLEAQGRRTCGEEAAPLAYVPVSRYEGHDVNDINVYITCVQL